MHCKIEIPLLNAWELYEKNPGRPDSSIGTLSNYKVSLNKFRKWIEGEKPQIESFNQVDSFIAKEFASHLFNTGISAKTFNDHVKALMLIYRVLMADVGFIQNPFDKNSIFRKTEKKQTRERLSKEQVKTILNTFDSSTLHLMHKEEHRILFYLGAYTGLRLVDCVFLKWSNIDFDNNVVRCIPRKTDRIQRKVIIPLLSQLKEKLDIAKIWKTNEYILPDIANRYLYNDHGVKKDNLKVFKYSGLVTTHESKNGLQRQRKACRFGFHSFRHTFASILAEEGVDVVKLSKILGDDCTTLNKYYIKLNEEAIKGISINF